MLQEGQIQAQESLVEVFQPEDQVFVDLFQVLEVPRAMVQSLFGQDQTAVGATDERKNQFKEIETTASNLFHSSLLRYFALPKMRISF